MTEGKWRMPKVSELFKIAMNLCWTEKWDFGAVEILLSSEKFFDDLVWGFSFSRFCGENTWVRRTSEEEVRLVRNYKIQKGIKYKVGQETETGVVFDIQDDMVFECKKENEKNKITFEDAIKKFGRVNE